MKTDTAIQPPGAARRRGGPPDLHGASLVDDRGIEIPITERMVQQALDDLDAAWQQQYRRRSLRRRPR